MSAANVTRVTIPQLPECWAQDEPERCWLRALEFGGDGVWDWNILLGEVFYGPRLASLLGYPEGRFWMRSEEFSSRMHPDDVKRLEQCVEVHIEQNTDFWRSDVRMRGRRGEYIWVQLRGKLIARAASGEAARMIGTLRNIDDRHHDESVIKQQLAESAHLTQKLEGAQEQLVQSEKLAAIGQLAAGVAHELKTPIGFVGTNFGTLERYVGDLLAIVERYRAVGAAPDPKLALADADAACVRADIDYMREDLPALFAESRDGLDRVQRIVRDLKDFSRVGEQEWQFADIHQGLDSTINILRYEIKHKAVVERHYGDLPKIWCVPSMINQVFLNLIANAAQSIEDSGTITIASTVEGNCAVVRISDTGCGMSPDVLARVFEPFFTTKAVGKGTGLGLPLAQDIVHKHHGRLTATSTPGKGSTFTVELPLSGLEFTTPADSSGDGAK